MAHFSPVNGAFPHKDQIDRTCLVNADEANQKIERGSIIVVNKNGEFELAADASNQPLYFALQGYDNIQAAFAGQGGFFVRVGYQAGARFLAADMQHIGILPVGQRSAHRIIPPDK